MAEILSFQDAQRRQALSYVERMTAFHAEMQGLSAQYGILGDGAGWPVPVSEVEVLYHPALRSA